MRVSNIFSKSKRSLVVFVSVFIFSVIGFAALVSQPIYAADGYPYPTMACVHSPYATSGKSTFNPTVLWCNGYEWGTIRNNATNASLLSPYGYGYRNCTDYVAWKVSSLGVQPAQYKGLGNAKAWPTNAPGKHLTVDTIPKVGSAAVDTDGTFGHVSFVENVNPDGTIDVSEFNKDTNGNPGTRHGTPAALGFEKFVHFEIYETNQPTNTSTPTPTPRPQNVKVMLMGDVTNTGHASAVVIDRYAGTASVAIGKPDGKFGTPGGWGAGIVKNADKYFLADVNGDQKMDIVAYFSTYNRWYVSISTGNNFESFNEWADFGPAFAGSTSQFVAKVDDTGKAAVVLYYANVDRWYVAPSMDARFATPTLWGDFGTGAGSYQGSDLQLVNNVTNDNKADLALYFANVNRWYVIPSTGSSFSTPALWGDYGVGAGSYGGSTHQLLGDVNGDNKADLALHFDYDNVNRWYVALSTGSGFGSLYSWADDGVSYQHSDRHFLTDVNGDNKTDKIFVFSEYGNWYVSSSNGTGFSPPNVAATSFGYTSPL